MGVDWDTNVSFHILACDMCRVSKNFGGYLSTNRGILQN